MSMFKAEYQGFKREDPTVLVKVTLYDDNRQVIKPTISKGKLVKQGKNAGEYKITQDGDQYCLSTKQVEKLPSGDYGLELWADNGAIFPSAGFIPVRIHRNADDSLSKIDPTLDLNEIIEDLHHAGLNVVFDSIEMLDENAKAQIASEVRDGKNHISLKIPRGKQGNVGPMPDLRTGKVTASAPGSQPQVTYNKQGDGFVIDYVLPRGERGDNWTEADKQAILDEVKKELDTKIGDAYKKASDDIANQILNMKY